MAERLSEGRFPGSECAEWALCLLLAAGCRSVTEPTVAPGWAAHDAAAPLTRAACVDLALRWAPNAQAWRARLLAAHAALAQAGTLQNPSLKIDWEDFGLFTAVPGVPLQQTFALGVVLEDLFARGRREAAARHDVEAALADVLAERRQLALEVCVAYDRLVAARSRVDLLREAQGVAERQRAATARNVAAGLVAAIALDRATADVAEAAAARARQEGEARAQELSFAFALGFDRPVTVRLAEPLAPPVAPPDDLVAVLAHAVNTRPELTAATARYQAQLERLHVAASPIRFLPGIGGGIRTNDGNRLGVASLDVALPIFDDGAAGFAAEDAGLLAAAAELRRVAQAIATEAALAAEHSTSAQLFLEQHARALARLRRDLRERAQRLFEAGEVDFDTSLLTIRDEVRARLDLLDAELAATDAAWPLRIDALLPTYAPDAR